MSCVDLYAGISKRMQIALASLGTGNCLLQVHDVKWLGNDLNSQRLQHPLQAQATREVGAARHQNVRVATTQLPIP